MKPKTSLLVGVVALLCGIVVWRILGWVRASREPRLPQSEPANLLEANRAFYEELWSGTRLVEGRRFNTWPLVEALLPASPARLEVGPGLRPRLPIAGTDFVELSQVAADVLKSRSGRVLVAPVSALPYGDATFDLVCAMDIVEHAEDGDVALAELARVTKPGGVFLLAVPLHAARWTPFDDLVGHRQRYEPGELSRQLTTLGFTIERSAAYGMKPRSTWLSDFGMRCLAQRRERAMWYYTHLLMPIGLWMQPTLRFGWGLIPTVGVDEVLLVCRRGAAG